MGTRLITSQGHTALDGVYKLVAVQQGTKWVPAIKLSETIAKVPNPGHKHVWRIYDSRGKATADLLCLSDEIIEPQEKIRLYHPLDAKISRLLSPENITKTELLLEDIMIDGKFVYSWPTIETMRTMRDHDLEQLDAGVKRIMNPHIYHVSLTKKLWDLKQHLINHPMEASEK